jgi:hypothetical protein
MLCQPMSIWLRLGGGMHVADFRHHLHIEGILGKHRRKAALKWLVLQINFDIGNWSLSWHNWREELKIHVRVM